MHRYLIALGCCALLLSGCDQPATEPVKVDVTVTIEKEEDAPKPPVKKTERGTIIGDSEGFFDPF
jgi:hypothetical protein